MSNPKTLPLSLAAGPVLTFFGVPIFGVLLLILGIDFMTGLWKAKVTKKLCSSKFGTLLNRAATYIILFIVIHALVATAPTSGALLAKALGLVMQSAEYALFFAYCTKEILSVFENLKAIQVATGSKEVWIIELAINKFGMNLDKILEDVQEAGIKKAIDEAKKP